MDISKLLELLRQQQQEQYGNITASAKQMGDRIKMADPEMQGPRLPERTPEELAMAEDSMAMVAGTVGSPGGKFNKVKGLIGKAEEAPKLSVDKLIKSADEVPDSQRVLDAVNATAERLAPLSKEMGAKRELMKLDKRGVDTDMARRAIQEARRKQISKK